ncbi:MAG: ATP-binding cassette domain-containing protein, partial [Bradyrhizobium sp.]
MSTPSLLEVANLTASYGSSQVLFGLSLRIENGEVVSLMGRNGMGKTTTVHAIAGLLHERSGKVRFAGETISDAAPHRVARLGLGLV